MSEGWTGLALSGGEQREAPIEPEARTPRQSNERSEVRMAGWTGLEPGADTFSKLVMARDFWFKRLSHRRLRRFGWCTAVHPCPRGSPIVMETFWRRNSASLGPELLMDSTEHVMSLWIGPVTVQLGLERLKWVCAAFCFRHQVRAVLLQPHVELQNVVACAL